MEPKVVFRPMISSVQKIALYETKNKFFIVGCNNNQKKFRMLKIDRTEPRDLLIVDDKTEYTEKEVLQVLNMAIKFKGSHATPPQIESAFGIVGFVRFLEGYYMILITKRRRVASIGLHVIYKIEDTSMIYIPHESYRVVHKDENRYLKMFQSVDLSSNFYFSYSYDITHSLQVNMAKPQVNEVSKEDDIKIVDTSLKSEKNSKEEFVVYGTRNDPERKFVWNNHLLSPIEHLLSLDWILYVMHGFISQSNVCVFGRPVYVTLIARRSNKYAGTRFLKRGANFNGDVANEVETEQMVIDIGVSSIGNLRASSFVQMRGSIPGQWSQDITKMVAKPAITFDLSDPFYETAGAHFNKVFCRYGSPVIILNLVKKREKKKHESQLSEELSCAISYLNQFLPIAHYIQYISFDMARMNKGKEANVMGRLADIARYAISKTGFYLLNGPPINKLPMDKIKEGNNLQTGIIRVNCVDCLDRTNTAQFAVGKCALAYQLYYLGLLENAELEFDSDCVRLLEVLYEDHGDTLALQYGGSQLVHRIKTYRKTAPWTSQGNDIMQTLSRYYSNTFSDAEKQHAINLFLGLFIPEEYKRWTWDQNTDYYLHHTRAIGIIPTRSFPLTQWWNEDMMQVLPLPLEYCKKKYLKIVPKLHINSESIDMYNHYHKTEELTIIGDTFEFMISHSIRDFMPHCVTNYSPFTVRVRPGRMREETTKTGSDTIKNPSLTGQSSTSSTTSSTSSSYDSDEGDLDTYHGTLQGSTIVEKSFSFENSLPSSKHIYGIKIKRLEESNLQLYERYSSMYAEMKGVREDKKTELIDNKGKWEISLTKEPKVSATSYGIYEKYIENANKCTIDPDMYTKYEKYADCQISIFSRNIITL